MDRREAMLRELNLYPLWVRREQPVGVREATPFAGVVGAAGLAENVVSAVTLVSSGVTVAQESAPVEAVVETAAEAVEGVTELGAELAGDLPTVADLFAVGSDAQAADSSPEAQAGRDSLLEFQLKHAGGALAKLDWPELKEKVRDCNVCALRAGCAQTVFGTGDEHADWLFIGEAPGGEEDAQGLPFVGESGRLLDNMLLAIGLRRNANVYIANVVKCRPPEDRPPHVGEIAACLPYLKRQIGLLQPRLIVVMGKTAATALLGGDAPLATLRGRVHGYKGIPLIVTYHPAYLLRKPTEKARVWEDLCLAVATMNGLAG